LPLGSNEGEEKQQEEGEENHGYRPTDSRWEEDARGCLCGEMQHRVTPINITLAEL
jgi:hypothetical protein